MFCSKCGKTIHAGDSVCPNCQAPIGDNRFGGIPYTSAQFTIAPGQTSFEPLNNYTRTTYTSMKDADQVDGEVDSRTTYRPVYEGASAPEDVRRDMRAAVASAEGGQTGSQQTEAAENGPRASQDVPMSQAARETLEELDEELRPDEEIDLSQFRSRPIQSNGRAGISRDVSEYIRKLEDNQGRRGASRRRAQGEVYDDYAQPQEDYDAGDYVQEDAYDDISDEEYEAYSRRAPRFGIGQIVKIVVALAVVAGLAVGIPAWIRYVRGNQSSSPIVGVSESLYEQGIALIKSHVESTYINDLISKYTTDGVLSLSTSLEQSRSAISALMPAEPAANDQTFMDALLAIEDNIGNAVTMDALAVANPSDTSVQDSEARWQIVNNSIAQLEAATSAEELTGVINGQTITVQTQTPAPTEAPVTYATLQKGDEGVTVQQLQVRLYVLGYLNDNRDGVFGSKTQTAIKLFQETVGLNPTGIADNETQTRLYADDAPYAPGATTPTPAPTAEPTPAPTEALIQPAEADGTGSSDNGTQAA